MRRVGAYTRPLDVGDIYFTYETNWDNTLSVYETYWTDHFADYCWLALGYCFPTRGEAQKHMDEVYEKIIRGDTLG